ncbi:MAG: hypothetical protein F6J98_04160 [Moorea sp. SIO4G2]|nr:hypothetical protein [Moorena sp. SIO4G2]
MQRCSAVLGRQRGLGGLPHERLHQDIVASLWLVRYGAASGAKKLNMKASPPLTHPTQHLPDSRFPIPDSRFPIPDSLLPTPYSLFPVPCSLITIKKFGQVLVNSNP